MVTVKPIVLHNESENSKMCARTCIVKNTHAHIHNLIYLRLYDSQFVRYYSAFVTLWPLTFRLPLPEVKMTGYWTINQGGNARRKLLCPTETHPIDIKVNTPGKHFCLYLKEYDIQHGSADSGVMWYVPSPVGYRVTQIITLKPF